MWWKKRWGVERKCTCARHARSAECAREGWHLVDSFDTEEEARRDAATWTAKRGVPYRAVDRHTGRVAA